MSRESYQEKPVFKKFHVPLGDYPTFNLENAVCNHGFFMMAPNVWDPSTKCFSRPLRLSDSMTSVNVTISQPPQQSHLLIKVHEMNQISTLDKEAILAQVARMLRLSTKDENDVQEFQKIYPEARQRGFGRIFRSPSLFEDAVKSLLLCYCNIESSLKMARLLCDLQLQLSNGLVYGKGYSMNNERKGLKRKRVAYSSVKNTQTLGNFPNASELASHDEDILKSYCKTGLRSRQIYAFAQKVHKANIQLRKLEEFTSFKELWKKLMKIKGFGPFASATTLLCIGFYQIVPIDTETTRHLKEVHEKNCTKENIKAILEEIYGRYAPFQSLAFWYELSSSYESKFGKLSELPSSMYHVVTGSNSSEKP